MRREGVLTTEEESVLKRVLHNREWVRRMLERLRWGKGQVADLVEHATTFRLPTSSC